MTVADDPAAQPQLIDPEPELLAEPASPVSGVVSTSRGLQHAAAALAGGTGPVAVDAERASGYRYGQRAFLVQLKRAEAGIWLIDPEPFDTLLPIQHAIEDAEWILHAATQDLPGLAELGLHPHRLFDTELAARMAGLPKVGLGAVVEQLLGIRLAKEHSAADWSRRPLPEDWLRYAALDVELLVELRSALKRLLEQQDKSDWAAEEFEFLRTFRPVPIPEADRWRRTSGLSRLKTPRKLAVLRELWTARESLAQQRDVTPGHLLPDSALIAAADAAPSTVGQLLAVPGFHGRAAKREAHRWLRAVRTGAESHELPQRHLRSSTPPPPRTWKDRNPLAFRRFRTAKQRLARRAEALGMMPETLLAPMNLKQLCWEPPAVIDLDSVQQRLQRLGARPWQIEQTAAIVTVALLEPIPWDEL